MDARPHLGELVDGRGGLLDVLEVVRLERPNGVLGLVDVPSTVRVEADAALRPEQTPHLADTGHVVVERLPSLGDLDLHRPAAVVVREHLGHRLRRHGGEGRVDPHLVAERGRLLRPAELDRGAQPVRRLLVFVLREGAELGDAGRPLEHHALAHRLPAEAGVQGDRDHVHPVEEVVEGGDGAGHCTSLSCLLSVPNVYRRPGRRRPRE